MATKPLIFAHVGDLHINEAREQNYIDFLAIISQLETAFTQQLSFVYIPGDVADHGQPYQYQLVSTGLKMLSIPVHIIGGDHDMENGGMIDFYKYLPAKQLPYSIVVNDVCCIFLDVCAPGNGGPDFRLGYRQLRWLENVLDTQQGTTALFMHTYPDDLQDTDEKNTLLKLIIHHKVAIVAMGHTHYNELANDGKTIYAATRSTGQIEEGPVGYAVTSLYNGVVSWRFRHLADPLPFVLITSPADNRLHTGSNPINDTAMLSVTAVVFSQHAIVQVAAWLDDNMPAIMILNEHDCWQVDLPRAGNGQVSITVEARDGHGRVGRHTIIVNTTPRPGKTYRRNGSDMDSIGAWPENGIFATQLGPNRNAKPIK